MIRKFALLLLLATLPFTGCDKVKALVHRKKADPAAPSAPAAANTASGPASSGQPSSGTVPANQSSQTAEEPPAPVKKPALSASKNASVITLCYHNIDDSGKMKALTISTAEFEKELQAVKDNGFSVISMKDFLAWRKGEKDIPAKSALITIDDGWVSAYQNAWPILKKRNYPFTLFIYINYVGTGGKSLTWNQLEEMRDAGVDIESHTYSHSSLKSPGAFVDNKTKALVKNDVATLGLEGWMRKEIVESKKTLENKLGIKVSAFAYPFGKYNSKALELVKEAKYEVAFTVYGQQLTMNAQAELLGRYAVEAGKPQIFNAAMKMIGGGVSSPTSDEPSYQQMASASMVTKPMDGENTKDPRPLIKANLATFGDLDPKSVEMRVSGLGVVPARYDSASKTIEYQVTKPLAEDDYTVFISGTAQGKRIETKWSFSYGTKHTPATPSPGAATATPKPKGKKR